MNLAEVKSMVDGLTPATKKILLKDLGADFIAVNSALPRANMTPPPELAMNAFRYCPIEKARVVLLGQDPYPGAGDAMGLSFSIPPGTKITPSLRNIFACLRHHKFLDEDPTNGDLTHWAKQGVLMLNCALTTRIGQPNAHATIWEKYTDKLIKIISDIYPQMIFILLGGFAQGKAKLIGPNRTIFTWGHPSSLNFANQRDGPAHFKYCDVFTRTNEKLIGLGEKPITWGSAPIFPPLTVLNEMTDPLPFTTDVLWIFTDGGTRGNGTTECIAAWAFYLTDGCYTLTQSGLVPADETVSTNQRAELMAMSKALEYLDRRISAGPINDLSFTRIMLISDSEYSIGCITKWCSNWLADKNLMADKKNTDLIIPAYSYYKNIMAKYPLTMEHIRSHKSEPTDKESEEWFRWTGNDYVDKLCSAILPKK